MVRSDEQRKAIMVWEQELGWREFYQQALFHFPELSLSESLLLGSILSAVDPVATLAIMGAKELNCDAAAVDAWSVTSASGTALRFIPPGIETQLFQVGLAPYLAYLWFLRDARATPRARAARAAPRRPPSPPTSPPL